MNEPPRTIEKETPVPVEQDESADEGAGSKDGGGEDRGGEEEPEGEVWQEETSQWPEELRNAFVAFARGKSWGGKHWERCVTQFIALERMWGLPSKGLLAAPNSAGDRPKEIPDFMQSGRKWKSTVELQSMCSPARLEESFGCRWWEWWGAAQPASRRKANGEFGPPHDVAASEWEEIGKMAGRNGLLLFLGGLLWWGEAAAAADDSEGLLDDWRGAVEDVAAVITEALKEAGPELPDAEKPQRKRAKAKEPSAAAPTTRSAKRKRPETRSATNKENKVPPSMQQIVELRGGRFDLEKKGGLGGATQVASALTGLGDVVPAALWERKKIIYRTPGPISLRFTMSGWRCTVGAAVGYWQAG
ncbi:hypothetical protein B0H13DRAFT_1862859 [Mycena leptocephala]|nr:hypothetical protein B0H13DRAFT_1862859 [Mycena leptocephala]